MASAATIEKKKGRAATTAEASDRDEAPAMKGEGRIHPECDCWWTARRISPGRAEAMRMMRESLTRMFEGMDDFISCVAFLDGAGGAEFRLRVGEDHGLRIRLDADPDC